MPVRIVAEGGSPVRVVTNGGDPVRIVTHGISDPIRIVSGGLVPDAPTFINGEVGTIDASTMVVTFSTDITAPCGDCALGFSVLVNNIADAITACIITANNTIQLTLATTVRFGEVITISYDSTVGCITESTGATNLVTFGAQAVTNNVLADYYIDYKNGNDTTGDGSSGNPLKTLTHTLTHAGNGNTIAARGTGATDEIYRERDIATSLTNLTIRADTGHTPVFTPAYARAGWSKTIGRSNVYQRTEANPRAWLTVFYHGSDLMTEVASLDLCDSTTNSWILDDGADIFYCNVGGADPITLEELSDKSVINVSGSGFSVIGISFRWAYRFLLLAANSVVSDCSFQELNWVSAVSGVIISAGTSHLMNDCTFGGTQSKAIAIQVQAGASGAIVQNCEFSNCLDGVQMQGGGGIVTLCTFDKIGRDCITGKGTWSYCIAADVGHVPFITSGVGKSSVVHHCIVYVPTGYTLACIHGFVCEDGATSEWYHNVAYGCIDNGYYILVAGSVATVKNCIASSCGIGFQYAAGTLTADYNCAYGNTTNYSVGWTPGAHDVADDPLFTNAGIYDFTLLDGSPCIDAGVAIAGINDDYLGLASDIGRYEKA